MFGKRLLGFLFLFFLIVSLNQSEALPPNEQIENGQKTDSLVQKSFESLWQLSVDLLDVNAEKSKIYAEAALYKARLAKNPVQIVRALYNLGMAYHKLGDSDTVKIVFTKALKLSRANKIDSLTIKILNRKGSIYKDKGTLLLAKEQFLEAFDLAEQTNDQDEKINSAFNLAELFHQTGSYKEALEYYHTCLSLKNDQDDKELFLNVFNRIGVIYYEIGNYERSLLYYIKSLEIAETLGDKDGIADALNNIGILHYDWGKKEEALEYYQKSLRIEEELGNELGKAGSYNNIGIIYSDWHQDDLAITYYQQALDIYEEYEDQSGIAFAKNNIGESFAVMGRYEEALQYLTESLEIELQIGTSTGVAQSYHSLAKLFYVQGDLRKAMQYNELSREIADSSELKTVLLNVNYLHYQINERQGNFKSALEAYIAYDKLKNSIYDQKFQQRIADLQLKQEIDISERERAELNRQNILKEHEIRTQRTYLLVIFVLMVVFGFLVYYDIRGKIAINRKLKLVNTELNAKKEELTDILNEKQKSERKYRNLVENSPTGILYLDAEGRILEVNKKLIEILGSPSEKATKEINVLTFTPLLKAGFADQIKKCIETKAPVSDESEYKTKWGRKVYLRYNIVPETNSRNKVSRLIVNVEDATLSKDADQKVRESETKYRMLVENSLQAMLIIQDMKIIFANHKLQEITGYSVDDLMKKGKNWLRLIMHPDDLQLSVSNVISALRGKAETNQFEYRIIGKDGVVRWIETIGSVVDYQGKPAIMMVALDINERKKAEQILIASEKELKNVNAMKDKFFSIIAHDLKNPFSSILGFANLLYEAYDSFSESQRKNFIKNICETSENTFKLLQNLLEWARTQTGNFEYKPREINVSTITNENLAIFNTSLKSKRISVDLKIPMSTTAWADENMIKTVIRNLLSNAIKFTPEKGSISIHTKTKKNSIEYYVSDTGIGISKKDLQKVFRIDAPLKKQGTNDETGSGIGLLLCKELIEINKGKIWVESVQNEGSHFVFTLPKRET